MSLPHWQPSLSLLPKSSASWLGAVLLTAVGATCVSFASMAKASAATIFDGGSPDQFSGNEMLAWVQAEDFVLNGATGTTLAAVHFWTGESGTTWDGTLNYYLFGDAGGMPASSSFAQGAGTNVTKTSTGNIVAGFLNEYFYTFDLPTPLSLSAGTTYWLGLNLSSNFNYNGIYWETSGTGFSLTGEESYGGTFDNWYDNGQNHAFYLTGPTSVAVPAPLPVLGAFSAFGFSRKLRGRIKTRKLAAASSTY